MSSAWWRPGDRKWEGREIPVWGWGRSSSQPKKVLNAVMRPVCWSRTARMSESYEPLVKGQTSEIGKLAYEKTLGTLRVRDTTFWELSVVYYHTGLLIAYLFKTFIFHFVVSVTYGHISGSINNHCCPLVLLLLLRRNFILTSKSLGYGFLTSALLKIKPIKPLFSFCNWIKSNRMAEVKKC